jgi:hypothetical protein
VLGKDEAVWQRLAALAKYGGYACACDESKTVQPSRILLWSVQPRLSAALSQMLASPGAVQWRLLLLVPSMTI